MSWSVVTNTSKPAASARRGARGSDLLRVAFSLRHLSHLVTWRFGGHHDRPQGAPAGRHRLGRLDGQSFAKETASAVEYLADERPMDGWRGFSLHPLKIFRL